MVNYVLGDRKHRCNHVDCRMKPQGILSSQTLEQVATNVLIAESRGDQL
jgi:hypothetical protein